MLDLSALESQLGAINPAQLRAALASFLPESLSKTDKVRLIETALRSPSGPSIRDAMARWIVEGIVPVEHLVPEAYLAWRAPVRDAMVFVIQQLSPARLAPKLLEQIELPDGTSAETRLLRLIAKVPGLQKLGQVIARNQHLRPALRTALARLENGIRDVEPDEIRAIIQEKLGPRLKKYEVRIVPSLLSEASVSAVVRFSWKNPESGRRELGVFKVLKPYVPRYFAEDMAYLQGLAQYFGERHHRYGFPARLIPDTFRKVRRLLQHEVNFAREQKTLLEAASLYADVSAVRVPGVIRPLCTPEISALTAERGTKVTAAAARLPAPRRHRIAEQIVEALVAIPLLTERPEAIFHGDPHAGNLLYDNRTRELTIIDWALRERLSREQRRQLALLFLMVTVRDPVGTYEAVVALCQGRITPGSARGALVRATVISFLDELPIQRLPGVADAMRLLERVALLGIRFPASLVMISKVMFTLDGLLKDVAGADDGMGFAIARHISRRWMGNRKAFRSPVRARDWWSLQCSALLYPARVWLKCEQVLLNRSLQRTSQACYEKTP